VQFPTVIGGVVPVVNIKGITPGQIKLTGQVLGDIYLGKITKWNDAAITGAEPRRAAARCRHRRRAPCRRLGHHFMFTNYLSKVNPEWKAKVGEGTAVNWPTGAGGKGNEGVSAFVQRLPNSIGYVEYAYAKQNKMTYVLMRTRTATSSRRTTLTFKAAAAGADWSQELLPDPDRTAGQGQLADHRRHLHPDAQGAGQAGRGQPPR
jgi:phosphate transport system substrate-binding protein